MKLSSSRTVFWQQSMMSSFTALVRQPRSLAEGVEQLDDAFAVQAFVAHRPADDLAHALHLVEAREVHQHREAANSWSPSVKPPNMASVRAISSSLSTPKVWRIIVLVLHFLVFEEHADIRFRACRWCRAGAL
jgi:hypothetical protein